MSLIRNSKASHLVAFDNAVIIMCVWQFAVWKKEYFFKKMLIYVHMYTALDQNIVLGQLFPLDWHLNTSILPTLLLNSGHIPFDICKIWTMYMKIFFIYCINVWKIINLISPKIKSNYQIGKSEYLILL